MALIKKNKKKFFVLKKGSRAAQGIIAGRPEKQTRKRKGENGASADRTIAQTSSRHRRGPHRATEATTECLKAQTVRQLLAPVPTPLLQARAPPLPGRPPLRPHHQFSTSSWRRRHLISQVHAWHSSMPSLQRRLVKQASGFLISRVEDQLCLVPNLMAWENTQPSEAGLEVQQPEGTRPASPFRPVGLPAFLAPDHSAQAKTCCSLCPTRPSLVAQTVTESACNAGDSPGWGRSPGEGNGNPLRYSCLENYMDRGAWWLLVLCSRSLLFICCIEESIC